MVMALEEITKWAKEKNRHEFKRSEIAHLLKGETQVATFGNWVHFGGIFYKRGERGYWGINRERAEQFLGGNLKITTCVLHDPLANTYEATEEGYITEVKGISAYCDTMGNFIVEYY